MHGSCVCDDDDDNDDDADDDDVLWLNACTDGASF